MKFLFTLVAALFLTMQAHAQVYDLDWNITGGATGSGTMTGYNYPGTPSYYYLDAGLYITAVTGTFDGLAITGGGGGYLVGWGGPGPWK